MQIREVIALQTREIIALQTREITALQTREITALQTREIIALQTLEINKLSRISIKLKLLPRLSKITPQNAENILVVLERSISLAPQLDFGSPELYIRIVLHLCYLCYRVSEFVLPPISDDKFISFGGGAGEMLAPKLLLGVQSGVNELCSICAICATGFQNLCYLPFFTTL